MVKIGIVGAGPNAAGHAEYFHESKRASLIAIADPDSARATRLASQFGARHLSNFEHFLDNVDAVVISSPNFLHREHSIKCARAGKHIFCEKPMGLSLSDAQEIHAAVVEAGVMSTIGFTVRFDPTIQVMQRAVRSGELGPLISLSSRRLFFMPASSLLGWRGDHNLSGGLLMEVNIHELEWMMALGGDVKSVYARTWSAEQTSPRSNDHIWFTLGFKNGAIGQHEGSWSSPNAQFFRAVSGTEAGLSTDEWGSMVYRTVKGTDREAVPMDNAFDLAGNFLDSIEGIAAAVADSSWGVKVMAVAEAIFESAASGKPVNIN